MAGRRERARERQAARRARELGLREDAIARGDGREGEVRDRDGGSTAEIAAGRYEANAPAADRREAGDRPRVLQFLIEVRAELKRVEWPDRESLVRLTGVVIAFVIVAGAYLGLLDFVFSRLVQLIL